MSSPPTGTVTFVFTDIEGSTKLWERDARGMAEALADHNRILEQATQEYGGYVFKTVGDAFCCAFATAPDALEAALEAQRKLLHSDRVGTGPLRVRMALHVGAAEERDGDYFGPPVNRVARLLSAAHGGQVLLSASAQEMVRDELPPGGALIDLGERRLKDLFRPERVFQLSAPDLPSEFPALRTLEGHPNNLPPQPTPLIGREREVGEIVERIRREESRLLTLTGPGGTGKTRLALQAAADLLEDFEDGAFFIALATITDPELVPPAIAGPLGLKESAERSLMDNLKGYLREKRLLLGLDNFEQVLEGASLVGELVTACPDLEVLATSRTPLGLYGEQEYAVEPLSVPDVRHLPDLKTLSQYEAVRLFIERAKSARAEFEVTDENAPAIAEICARLDGLPLAIELAAARVKMLPPQAMLRRLGNRLKLLTGGARDLPERQRTLRATIEWSHALLDEGEQTLFGRLAVFSGGRTLEAIEAVCDPEGDLPVDSFEGISSLLDKSLLRQEEGAGAEPRFYMLEIVHEFALEKLEESVEAEEIKRLHALYFLDLAEEAEPRLRGPDDVEWLERLEAEHDNMRAALSWALERGEVELGLRLAGALWRYWEAHGHYSEGRRWLEEALAKANRASAAVRSKVLEGLGWLMFHSGEKDRAVIAAQEGLELSERAGLGGAVVARFLLILGAMDIMRGEDAQAKEPLEESLVLSREADDKWGTAETLLWLTNSLDSLDRERANELREEGISLAREMGYVTTLASFLFSEGYASILEGDYERGVALSEEAATLFREHGHRGGGLEYLLDNLGWAALYLGDPERSRAAFEEGLALCVELGAMRSALTYLDGLACVAVTEGGAERAARLFGAAEALSEAVGWPLTSDEEALMEPYLRTASTQVEEGSWEEAWAEGRAMSFDEAVSHALGEDGDG